MKLLDKLTGLWGRWFGKTEEPMNVTPETVKAIPWDKILALLGPSSEQGFDPTGARRVEYKLPEPLPGVRPAKLPTGDALVLAMDSGVTETQAQDDALQPAAWGFAGTGSIGPGLAFLGFPFLAELAQITEYRAPAEALSTEMTRRWFKLKNRGKRKLDDKLKEIETRFEQLRVRDLFREAALKTEQFGRAHIYISISGQDGDRERQLPLTKIEKGTLLGLSCIEPYWLTPYSWNATHPERPDFYRPQSWFVLGRKTHSSRMCTFIFREVPDLLKPAYDFSGISMTQLMMPYVQRWLRTAKNVNDLINIFSIVTLSTDLQALVQDPAKFMKRLQAFTTMRDNRGLMAVNKGTEELTTQNIPLGSLDKLQAQSQEHMSTPARMPLIKFFGITPTGLNATAEPEQTEWNDYAHAMQELGFSPHAKRLLEFVQMDMYGEVDEDIVLEWIPLKELTGKELAEVRKSDADRDQVYITANVVSPDEIRDKLRMDPESGYNGLEGDAPEPQMWSETGEGGEGEEVGKADKTPQSKGKPKEN